MSEICVKTVYLVRLGHASTPRLGMVSQISDDLGELFEVVHHDMLSLWREEDVVIDWLGLRIPCPIDGQCRLAGVSLTTRDAK